MISQGIQLFNAVILMCHMIHTLRFLQQQGIRDTSMYILFMAQRQRLEISDY